MYPTTQEFQAALRESHDVATRCYVTTPDGLILTTLTPNDGDVTVATGRSVRRDCSLAVADDTGYLTPATAADLLSPLTGNEIRPFRGVTIGGVDYLVPLGVFPLRSSPAVIGEDGAVVITVGSQDRSTTVSRNKWTDVYPIASGAPLEDAIGAILSSRAPQYPYDLVATGITLPAVTLGLDVNNDPWADAVMLANSAGYDLVYDVTGVAVLVQPTDPVSSSPSIDYLDDDASVTLSASKAWDTELAYNGCIVIGEGSGSSSSVRGEAWDDDPESPTYYLGAYGKYPEIIVSPLVTTTDQAQAYAEAQLSRRRGVAQTVEWTQIVNPALDAYDVVRFRSAGLRIESAINVAVDSLTIPLSATGTMKATTRTRQVQV